MDTHSAFQLFTKRNARVLVCSYVLLQTAVFANLIVRDHVNIIIQFPRVLWFSITYSLSSTILRSIHSRTHSQLIGPNPVVQFRNVSQNLKKLDYLGTKASMHWYCRKEEQEEERTSFLFFKFSISRKILLCLWLNAQPSFVKREVASPSFCLVILSSSA